MAVGFILFSAFPLYTNAQKLTFEKYEVLFEAGDGDFINGYIDVENLTGDTLAIEWRVIENTTNNDWLIQFCDFIECTTNEFGPLPTSRGGDIPPGYSDQWYLGVDVRGLPGSQAVWQIEVEYFNSGLKDTVIWNIDKPSNVASIDAYVKDISLYPNPASNLIQVSNTENRMLHYRILDVSGKELSSGRVSRDQEPLNIEALSSGLYFFNITDEQTGSQQLLKFIKR